MNYDDPYYLWARKWADTYPAVRTKKVARRRRKLAIAELDSIARFEGRPVHWWSAWKRHRRQVGLLTVTGNPRVEA